MNEDTRPVMLVFEFATWKTLKTLKSITLSRHYTLSTSQHRLYNWYYLTYRTNKQEKTQLIDDPIRSWQSPEKHVLLMQRLLCLSRFFNIRNIDLGNFSVRGGMIVNYREHKKNFFAVIIIY